MTKDEYVTKLEEIYVDVQGMKNFVQAIQQLNNEAIPTYDSKLSRQYFQPNYNPQKAHKNGYRLATRELRAVIGLIK